MTQRIVVAITGASGAVFGVRALERLREFDVETHLIVSPWGAKTIEHETGRSVREVRGLANVSHRPGEQGATISSGSFVTLGMLVAPCSVKTLAAIASGYADDLVARAADVVLKERRKLVLMVRESPLSAIHLENMLRATRAGAVILPPMPGFYTAPRDLDEMVDHVVTRALDQFGLHSDATKRWDGQLEHSSPRMLEEDEK
ncbi:MAG TPA: UbiX family flavin prenyltransferase [Pseudolysinimonas sp.]